jgi:hypothetical protein
MKALLGMGEILATETLVAVRGRPRSSGWNRFGQLTRPLDQNHLNPEKSVGSGRLSEDGCVSCNSVQTP